MVDAVSPTDPEPRFHVTLGDTDNRVGFVLYNSAGKRDPTAIRRFPLQESAIKIVQGESKYSDDEIPGIVQADWGGGRGNEVLENDNSRFFDSYRMNTQLDGAILGGREIYTTGGWRDQINNLPGQADGVFWNSLQGTTIYWARQFTVPAGGGFGVKSIEIWARQRGYPANLQAAIYTNVSGSPGALHGTLPAAVSYDTDNNIFRLYEFIFSTANTIVASTTYWLVVYATGTPDDFSHWEIGLETTTGKTSANGSSWSSSTQAPYFRLCDAATDFVARFYEYKGQLYFATHPDDGSAGKIYMNGFRGVCDTNADLGKLIDATQSFSGFTSAIAKIVAGEPNAIELKPWRVCTIDSTIQLDCTPDWVVEHDDMAEYVILGTDVWSEVGDSGGYVDFPISDVTVGNGMVFLAQAGGHPLIGHREWNNGGVWTWDTNSWRRAGGHCHFVELLNDLTKGPTLWMARNPGAVSGAYRTEYKSWVQYASLPAAWDGGNLFWNQLDDGQDAWDEQVVTNVTASFTNNRVRFALTADFSTGIVGSEAITSVNLTYGNYIELTIQTGKEMGAGDLQLLLSNLPNCVTPLFTLNFPYLKKDEAQTVRLPFDPEGVAGADEVISIGLQITTDKDAAFNIEIIGEVILYYERGPVKIGRGAENVTGVQIYDDPERFWIFTEGEIGYMQGDIYTPIPLREMRALRSIYNGLASTVAGVYLFFSMAGGRVMRYFRQNLDSIGPDRDAGMPSDRVGYVSDMTSYPGDKVIIAYDGGEDNYSSILLWAGNGWHELFRSPRVGMPIRSLYVQSVDGSSTGRLWFSMGADVCWIPISPNPFHDPDYRFTHDGHIITSWMYAGKQAIDKVFHNLSLFTENMTDISDKIQIEVDYQLDDDNNPSNYGTEQLGNRVFNSHTLNWIFYKEGDTSGVFDKYGRITLIPPSEAYSGAFAVNVSIPSLSGSPNWYWEYNKKITTEPGDVWRLSLYVKQRGNTSQSGTLGVEYIWYDEDGTEISTDYNVLSVTTSWAQVIDTSEAAPSNVAYMKIRARIVNTYGSPWDEFDVGFDSLSLRKSAQSRWKPLASVFDTSPVQVVPLDNLISIKGRRIRLRFRFNTTNPEVSPRLRASVLKTYAIQDIKYGYSFTTKLSEDDLSIDLEGDEVASGGAFTRVETVQQLLDLWAANLNKLTFDTIYSPMTSKQVLLKAIPFQPMTSLPDDQIEEQFLQVVVHEFATT